MEDKKALWWRVVDEVNPLYGCDVQIEDEDEDGFCVVTSLRRFDLLVGDRPFQLRPGHYGRLGVSILGAHLKESPIQDDTVEIAYDRPFGKCLDEFSETNATGLELSVALYEEAIQIAFGNPEQGELIYTCTLRGDDRRDKFERIVELFHGSVAPEEDVLELMKMEEFGGF